MSNILYQVRLYKNNRMLYKTTRRKRISLLNFIKAKFLSEPINKVYFGVRYGKGNKNEGFYNTFKEFKQAYTAFTEKPLIDYLGR